MKIPTLLVRASRWTFAAYATTQILRFSTNIVLARLLAPDLFGIMVIVNGVRTAVALVTDLGVGQSVVVNRNGEDPDFYDTAWTINLVRSLLLFLACAALAIPLARFYQIESLAVIFPVAGLYFVFGGLASMAVPLMQKRMQYKRINAFEIVIDLLGFTVQVLLAFLSPTIWALVFGGLFSFAVRMIGSYLVLPGLRHRLFVSPKFARQIVNFGKWIFLSSVAYIFASHFDRLYLGKVMPLELLGVYGVSRALAEPVSLFVSRLNQVIIFPLIASSATMQRLRLRRQVAPIRFIFLLATAAGVATLAASADLLVGVLYDSRYQAAAWMVPVLIVGAWFAILCDLNESTLLGFGKPSYAAAANSAKLAWLVVGLPVGFMTHGPLGAVVAVATSDLFRYIPISVGQVRSEFSFLRQDLATTAALLAVLAFWEWVRWTAGLGTSFADLPINKM